METVKREVRQKPKGPTLLDTADRLNAIGIEMAEQGFTIECLNQARAAVQEKIEALPVRWDAVKEGKFILFFVLSGNEWWPCSAGEVIEDAGPYQNWLRYRIDYADGASESGVQRRGRWAHCTADDTVNYHWLDAYEPPPEDIVAWADRELSKGTDLGSIPGEIDMAGPGVEKQIGPDIGTCRECFAEGVRLWRGECEDCQD